MNMALSAEGNDQSVGDQARRGSLWMSVAAATSKGLGAVTQLILAGIMPRSEFGIYATAISLSVLLSVMRDGGLPTVLMQHARRFDIYAGPVFWMMLLINGATGLVIALAAHPLASFYHQSELAAVIELFALTVPLCVPVSVLSLRLTSQMRFTELSVVPALSAVLRNGLLLLFAYKGMGAKSFMLSMLLGSAFDIVVLWRLTRYAPWRRPVRLQLWPRLMRSGRWVLLGTFASALGNNGAYFIMAKVLPSEDVGVYFFAFQLVTLLGVLLVNSAYQVLLAAFARMNGDIARLRSAILRAIEAIALVGAIASLSVAVVFTSAEHILWHGKWSSAVTAVTVLAIVWPTTAFVNVLYAAQAAVGRFRAWGAIAFATALASVVGSSIGAMVGHSAGAAAIGYGVGNVLIVYLNLRYSLPPFAIRPSEALNRALRPWGATTLAAMIAVAVSRQLQTPILQFAVGLIVFGGVSILLLRAVAKESLQQVVASLRHSVVMRPIARRLSATRVVG